MRVPLSWLREYVDFDLSPEELAERLTMLGMEVQKVERRGEDWHSIVVGELLEVAPHPASAKLLLTRLQVGHGQGELRIVTGATNVAAGQRVPVAVPGAVLPSGRRIEVATLAGTRSEGMLCSGDELGLSADAEGILILPPETPVGMPLAELYGEVIIDVDVKPNRGDALSLVGVAREVAAVTGSELRWPPTEPPEGEGATADHLSVEVLDTELCPRFVGRYIEGVELRPSPFLTQLRLTAAGIRPVSNVVDASNYVMVELGKPTHAFDADRIAQGRLVVRRAHAGEKLETLDHVVRELDPSTLLIADPEGPLAIAGVMGGAASEVGEGTSRVAIESAIFDPLSIRRTAHRYALRSEASLRFEKGQEWRLAELGADRVARLVAEWAGGRVARGRVDSSSEAPPQVRVPFRPRRVSRLLGVELPGEEMADLLGRVGIETAPAAAEDTVPVIAGESSVRLSDEERDEALVAYVPSHRRDLLIEADIAEEVARIRGYETIPGRRPETPMPPYRPDPRRTPDRIRDLLSGRGLSETINHALVGPEDHERLGLAADDPATIRIANPVAVDYSELRRSLLPGLVRTLVVNERQRREQVAIFELGSVHRFVDGLPVEAGRLGVLLAGEWGAGGWDRPATAADVADLKGILEWLAERLALGRVTFGQAEVLGGVEHPGRLSSVSLPNADGSIEIGRVAELDPSYLAAHEIRAERVSYAELDLDEIARLLPAAHRLRSPPRVPPVERDLAVVVEEHRSAGDVEAVIRESAGELLQAVTLFDRYEGPPLAGTEVSLAYRLQLQAADRTLEDEEVEGVLLAVVEALTTRLDARLRS